MLATNAAAGERRTIGAVEVAATGAPAAWFNPAFVVERVSDPHRTLPEVIGVLAAVAPRFAIHVVDGMQPELEAAAVQLGLDSDDDLIPGMAMSPIILDDPTGALQITQARTDDDWTVFCELTGDAFGMTPEVVTPAFPVSVMGTAGTRWFFGRVDGQLVGTAGLVMTGDVAGIYNIGVVERERGKGYGAALTAAALRGGVEQGADVAVLQSSPAGFSVYERMGFRTVNRYRSFVGSAAAA